MLPFNDDTVGNKNLNTFLIINIYRRVQLFILLLYFISVSNLRISFADEQEKSIPFQRITLPNELTVLIRNVFHKSTPCLNSTTKTAVINSDKEFRSFRDQFKPCGDLAELGYVPIDFNRDTLLVQYMSGSCGAGFQLSVFQNDSAKTVRYAIKTISQLSKCSGPPNQSLNAIAIPKIPKGYRVTFESEPERNQGKVIFKGFVKEGEMSKEEREKLESMGKSTGP